MGIEDYWFESNYSDLIRKYIINFFLIKSIIYMINLTYQYNFFIIFSLLSIISTCLVIYCNKIVYSVISLLIFFFNIACLLLLFKIEFLSVLIILIYISAITIFFLFIVMTTNLKISGSSVESKLLKHFIFMIFNILYFIESINLFNSNFAFNFYPYFLSTFYSTVFSFDFQLNNFSYINNFINFLFLFNPYIIKEVYNNNLNKNFFHFIEIFKLDEQNPLHSLTVSTVLKSYSLETRNNNNGENILFNKIINYLDIKNTLNLENLYDLCYTNPFYTNNLQTNKEILLPINYDNSFPGIEFHSLFYNRFIVEILTIGLILLVCLIGIIILASTNRFKNEFKAESGLFKTPIFKIF